MFPEDDGGLKVLPMSAIAVKEMVCDWIGAGKAQGFVSPKEDRYPETRKWYQKNKAKMSLHPTTRAQVEYILA